MLDPDSTRRIDVELTVTSHAGDARFTFPEQRRASILINPSGSANGDYAASAVVDARRRQVSGTAESGGFCAQPTRYRAYFVAGFNRPFVAYGTWHDRTLQRGGVRVASRPGGASSRAQVGVYVTFEAQARHSVEMQVGVSFTSISEARRNLAVEVGRRSSESLQRAAQNAWRTQLSKVAVNGGTTTERRLFYTSLYHALIEPSTLSDADGSYVGMDGRLHEARGVTQYTNISG